MSTQSRPISLVAERAVRYLRTQIGPVSSRRMARELLATAISEEAAAQRVLEAAFGGDPRLIYEDDGWREITGKPAPTLGAGAPTEPEVSAGPEPDRTLIVVRGEMEPEKRRYRLRNVSVIRLQGDEVLAACGGDALPGPQSKRLRRAILDTLDGAVPVIHDPPGSIRALEEWLDQPLEMPISLRRLGQRRLGLPARHDLETIVGRLKLSYRETEDPLEQADTLDACLQALRKQGETLNALRVALEPESTVDWSNFAFDRKFLEAVPETPGTYEFFDKDGNLIYVGRSKNLNRRLASYFQGQPSRSPRVQRLLATLYEIRYDVSGSGLEAALREAELIATKNPAKNIQRNIEPRGRGARLRSILILEPAAPPSILRAYLIRGGRLIDRVGIGPRGGGLKRIQRILDDNFFSSPDGPTVIGGPDLDVEVLVRWLAENRDSVVAFDPTDLQTSQEVIDRLRWFLTRGSPFDPDGLPIHSR